MIIALHGLARSGKNTATDIICKELDNQCQVEAFADPIKAMLAQIGVNCSDDMKEVCHPILKKTPRQLMNLLGNEWGRNLIYEDIWVNLLFSKRHKPTLIISDVRRENEASAIRERGGVIIHIIGRGGIPGNYESEQGIKVHSDDYIISNDSTIEDLEHNIKQLLLEILV